MNPTKLALASNNQHKIFEFKKILTTGFSLLTAKELGLDFEVEETESTFEGNARLKSEHLYKISGMPSIADDSGICVSALDGRPGVYSARYGKPGFTDRAMKFFVLPGGHPAVSTLHVVRCVCRRAERLCVNMQEHELFVDTLVIKYINRLSDYLFVLARYTGLLLGVSEVPWKPRING